MQKRDALNEALHLIARERSNYGGSEKRSDYVSAVGTTQWLVLEHQSETFTLNCIVIARS